MGGCGSSSDHKAMEADLERIAREERRRATGDWTDGQVGWERATPSHPIAINLQVSSGEHFTLQVESDADGASLIDLVVRRMNAWTGSARVCAAVVREEVSGLQFAGQPVGSSDRLDRLGVVDGATLQVAVASEEARRDRRLAAKAAAEEEARRDWRLREMSEALSEAQAASEVPGYLSWRPAGVR